MSTPADLALLALDPATGRSRLGSHADLILGGGVLHDLLLAGRIAVDGEGRHARVSVVDGSPTGSPVVDPALARLASRGKALRPRDAVGRLGKGLPKAVHADLVARGLLVDRSDRWLGLVPRARYVVLPAAGRDELVAGVRAVLLGEREPDERHGALAALVGAADLVRHLVPRERRREATKRAKTLTEGAWASEGVRAAVKASEEAMMIAVMAATTTAAAGGSS